MPQDPLHTSAEETSSASRTRPASARSHLRTRVLAVEDEHDIAGLIKHTLERGGDIEVQVVESGDAALKAAAENTPDLILLDLNLPVLNGLELCRLLRSRPATKAVPIIMLTARTTESDRVIGLDTGADDYVSKPFSLRELSARVRAVPALLAAGIRSCGTGADSGRQNTNRTPSCTVRGARADVYDRMCMKFGLVNPVTGLPNCGWFRTFCDSARNSIR